MPKFILAVDALEMLGAEVEIEEKLSRDHRPDEFEVITFQVHVGPEEGEPAIAKATVLADLARRYGEGFGGSDYYFGVAAGVSMSLGPRGDMPVRAEMGVAARRGGILISSGAELLNQEQMAIQLEAGRTAPGLSAEYGVSVLSWVRRILAEKERR